MVEVSGNSALAQSSVAHAGKGAVHRARGRGNVAEHCGARPCCAAGESRIVRVAALVVALALASSSRSGRTAPDRVGVVTSGADGKVIYIAEASPPGAAGALYRRVSVFMSPLNVHVNRAPMAGEVIAVEHIRRIHGRLPRSRQRAQRT